MPYIDQDRRRSLDQESEPETAGELNFVVTRLIDRYLGKRGGLSYARINEVIGVLECAKLEAYRRIAAPYEDTKMSESGDVYTTSREA
jgi:hypothetical protein